MPSSVSSESSSIIAFSMPSSEFEQGEGEQEGNLELEEEVRVLKDLISAKDLELQAVKRQLDDVKNGQTGLFSGRLKMPSMDGSKCLLLSMLLLVIIALFAFEKEMGPLKDQLNEIIKNHIDQIVIGYSRKLPAANYDGYIKLENGHQYTPEMDIFLRYGAAHCSKFIICLGTSDGFVGYPANFFDNLIQHYYETKAPTKAVRYLDFDFSLENPASWPAALVQPQAGEMNVEEWKVDNAWRSVDYFLRNKHNPGIGFKLRIYFKGAAKCYQQMTRFVLRRAEDVKNGGA